MTGKAEWTVMIYMAGDNNLSDAAERDLVELRRVGSSPDLNLVVEVDHAGPGGTRRILVGRDGLGERQIELGEADSGAPEVLADFLAWATEHYPARRYALVLWSHGSGWEPSEVDRIAQAVHAPGYVPGEAVERSASALRGVFFRSSLERIFQLPTPEERAICSDDGSGNSLDMIELEAVLAQAVGRLGQPFDLVGMDACLMSNLEVAYQIAPHARYLVASEELEPNQGWPYDTILDKLAARPDMPSAELATTIVTDYLAFYDALAHTPVTQAAIDLGRLDRLTGPLDALSDALVAAMPGAAAEIWAAQRAAARFQTNTLWDIDHFSAALAEQAANPGIAAATAAVRAALEPGPEGLVLANGTRGAKVAACGGLSIYLLPNVLELSRYYPEVRYAINHRWLTMLKAYHAA